MLKNGNVYIGSFERDIVASLKDRYNKMYEGISKKNTELFGFLSKLCEAYEVDIKEFKNLDKIQEIHKNCPYLEEKTEKGRILRKCRSEGDGSGACFIELCPMHKLSMDFFYDKHEILHRLREKKNKANGNSAIAKRKIKKYSSLNEDFWKNFKQCFSIFK